MNFWNDVVNHVTQLETAIEKSLASLPARALATIKADPAVSATLMLAGAIIGAIAVAL